MLDRHIQHMLDKHMLGDWMSIFCSVYAGGTSILLDKAYCKYHIERTHTTIVVL